jgi:Acetyl-CoA dehydrogenase C-terminal like/Acyl-CoA dehydrogenase, C-terminal domain
MNAARVGVAIQGLAQGDIAYQNGLQYAKDRRQGRSLTGAKEPSASADPIIVHPDVRRMLMEAKAYTEGLRALCLWGAFQSDLIHAATSDDERQAADDLLSLLTPVMKGYGTDMGYQVATNMQQIYGGHGFIEEWGMSQYVRDARITMIYEGANGIQALDLVGRKLAANGGRGLQAFFALVAGEAGAAKAVPELADYATRLEAALADLQAATMWLMQNGMANPDNAGAGSTPYMHLMGIVSLGLMWLRMASAAQAALNAGNDDRTFMQAKLITARFFAERIMPDTAALRRKLESGAEAMMAMPVEGF